MWLAPSLVMASSASWLQDSVSSKFLQSQWLKQLLVVSRLARESGTGAPRWDAAAQKLLAAPLPHMRAIISVVRTTEYQHSTSIVVHQLCNPNYFPV